MSYAVDSRFGGLRVDRVSATFAVLLVIVTALGIGLAEALASVESVEPVTNDMSSGEQAATGVAWAVFEVAVAAAVLVTALLFQRLPDAIQAALKTVGKTAVLISIGGFFAFSGEFLSLTGILLVTVGVLKAVDELDLYWIVNDLVVVAVAVYLAAYAGFVLSPWVLAAALVGLSIYDHVFANQQSWMFDLMQPMVKLRLPILFVVPTAWRFDWDVLAEDGEDGDVDAVGFGIGMADLALPAAFAVSVFGAVPTAGGAAVTAAIVAGLLVACARMSWALHERGSGAGLPPLTGGALAGCAVGLVWMVVFL